MNEKDIAFFIALQIKSLITVIKDHDIEVKSYYKGSDDHVIFDSLLETGPVFSPHLLVAFGEYRDRYKTVNEMQQYAEIMPVLERSGKQA